MDQKKYIFMMAGALGLAVIIFAVVFLMPKNNGAAPGTEQPGAPNATGTPDTPPPGSPTAQGTMVAALPPTVAPPAPLTPAAAKPPVAALPDPFSGGPKPPPPPPKPKASQLPSLITLVNIPSITLAKGPGSVIPRTGPTVRDVPQPVGRHAGWIYSTNGQVVAIFEDRDGVTRSVRVGDDVGGLRVKAITPDALVLVDDAGREQRIRLQSLQSFQGRSRTTDVEATPAPAWGR